MSNRWGTMETVTDLIFLGSKITADGDCSHEIKKDGCSLEEKLDQPRQNIKKQRHYFADKGPSSQSHCFSSSHVWMFELDHQKAKCWRIDLLNCGVEEDCWESLDCRGIKPVNPKGNQSWICIGRTDANAETAIVWSPVTKNWLFGKNPDAGRD